MQLEQRPTAVDSTVRILREEIVDGDHRVGDRLTESGLTERLRVSRSTAREALRILAARGLVELVPNHGARVSGLDPDGVVELYRVRSVVEPMLVERFCERASAAQLRDLEDAMVAMSEIARDSDDLRRVYRASDAFYEALVAGAGSPSIAHAVRTEHARLFGFRRSALPADVELERLRGTTGDVRRLMPMMIRRDARMVGNFSRRAMVEDAAATLRLLRSSRG